jgi:hypothetical protein
VRVPRRYQVRRRRRLFGHSANVLRLVSYLKLRAAALTNKKQEQAALQCAQQAMWVAHDYLFPLWDESDD